MIETVQIVLLIVIVVFAILAIILGIQVFFILKDFRKTITKANKVLDTADTITESVSGPISTITSLTNTFKATSLLTVAKLIKSLISRDDEDDKRTKS